MITAGLDVGSRNIKLVIFDEDIKESLIVPTGTNPLHRSKELLSGKSYHRLVVTGYGRHLVADALHAHIITEIKAFALGARFFYPDCHTVIDMGGQDCKVIRCDERGKVQDCKAILLSAHGAVQKFEMNDRCAAGTGKFLEIMASSLEVDLDHFSDLALQATRTVHINSLCTVFAESEVVSLIGKGEEPSVIALALHDAIATRIAAMEKKNGLKPTVVFAGGAALNQCLAHQIEKKLGVDLLVSKSPQFVGALGAALSIDKKK